MFACLSLFLIYPSRLLVLPVVGVLLIVIFFGLRRLGYQELSELGRIQKRIVRQRAVFASNIRVRKTVAFLTTANDLESILKVLREGLQKDFDGFELALDPEFVRQLPSPTQGSITRIWNESILEKAIYTVELSLPQEGIIGQLSLRYGTESQMLVDPELLAGDLRRSLSMALGDVLSRPQRASGPAALRKAARQGP